MSKLRKFAMRKDNAMVRLMIMTIVPMMLMASVSLTAYAQSGYVIYDGNDRRVVLSDATEPSQVLDEHGFELGRADIVEMNDEGMRPEITVRRNQLIYINNGGQSMVTNSYGETVGELLERIHMPLNGDDTIDVALETMTYDGMELNIDRWTTSTEFVYEEIPFETEYVQTNKMLKGDEKVVTEGVNGELKHTTKITYFNGEEVSREVIAETARTFGGVAHRCELVRELDGGRYYNSSIDSSPTRTEAALRSFTQKVIVICGGYDKNIPYEPLAKPLIDCAKTVVLVGATAPKIKAALLSSPDYHGTPALIEKTEIEAAVNAARDAASAGDIVILSPASASFDMFKNFEERGNRFKEIVNRW